MSPYIHQKPEWPNFTWDERLIGQKLAAVRHRQGLLTGRIESLGFSLRTEASLRTLTEDVVKTSEIEGENLDAEQVRSSIARRLGIDIGALVPADRNVEGIVEMMLDATQNYDEALTTDRLFKWHAALFPTGHSNAIRIKVGNWRDDHNGPMQVVSGPLGRERVHFEAPSAEALPNEMELFLQWFNAEQQIDPVLKAAIAHFWFVTVHPFEDGNGRMARAIADMQLAKSEDSVQRFYSVSSQIKNERQAYYKILEATQRGGLDITPWLVWFLQILDQAFDGTANIIANVFKKAKFWEQFPRGSFNARQQLMLDLLLQGFEGKLTSAKWAVIAKTSADTALRDITELMARDVLQKGQSGGRSTDYVLNPEL